MEFMMKGLNNKLLLPILLTATISCQNKQQVIEHISSIDSTLQANVTSILEDKLSEINTQSGQVIVMEVQTGQIKALVGLERKDSADYQPSENFHVQQLTGLVQPISLLAALETEKVKMSDKVDVGNGIYICKGDTVFDHNWHRGGYDEITVKQGLACSSNIATVKTMENAFGDNTQAYFDVLSNMSYGKPDSINGIGNLQPYKITEKNITWNSIGYEQFVSPIQTLTFYNAIANNGKMVQPQLYQDSVVVINSQIAGKASIDSLKQALLFNVTDGLGKPAFSDKVTVAGRQGTIVISANEDDTEYAVEFCGYFPVDNPKYSIIVSINKTGLPASGGLMAGDVFKKIVDNIIEE
jgi:cell division protein ftsI/penicillin-binding protein 2